QSPPVKPLAVTATTGGYRHHHGWACEYSRQSTRAIGKRLSSSDSDAVATPVASSRSLEPPVKHPRPPRHRPPVSVVTDTLIGRSWLWWRCGEWRRSNGPWKRSF